MTGVAPRLSIKVSQYSSDVCMPADKPDRRRPVVGTQMEKIGLFCFVPEKSGGLVRTNFVAHGYRSCVWWWIGGCMGML
jgi:hypothetical protein